MQVTETPLAGAVLLTPRRFGDDRGWFSETFNARAFGAAGLRTDWVQDNHSRSAAMGTLRGLHYQSPPHAQAKLVRCTAGAVWDVAVDVRRGSETFGAWHGAELSAENGAQFLIPDGFLHGFVTLTEGAEVQYKCSDYYAPEADGAVRWDTCGIDWPAGLFGTDGPVLSDKDRAAPALADWDSPFGHDSAG